MFLPNCILLTLRHSYSQSLEILPLQNFSPSWFFSEYPAWLPVPIILGEKADLSKEISLNRSSPRKQQILSSLIFSSLLFHGISPSFICGMREKMVIFNMSKLWLAFKFIMTIGCRSYGDKPMAFQSKYFLNSLSCIFSYYFKDLIFPTDWGSLKVGQCSFLLVHGDRHFTILSTLDIYLNTRHTSE